MKHRRRGGSRWDATLKRRPARPGPWDNPRLRPNGRRVHPAAQPSSRLPSWHRPTGIVVAVALVIVAVAIVVAVSRRGESSGTTPHPITLPTAARSYLGLYERGLTSSYAGVDQFARAIGRQPNLVTYYSAWGTPFQADFATSAARHGAVPLIQLNPGHVRLTTITSGQYDAYLDRFAAAVRDYREPVVIGFGHEMNGWWYPWGYRHASPASFVAAWRHIVTVFRAQGAWNVTWLWTINVIDTKFGGVAAPGPWWPGSSYVTWVGIDGYYYKRSWTFAPLFGPAIKAVRALTHDPILISETGAGQAADQPAKIRDLFAGTRSYGLLGFVWFNANSVHDWQLTSPAALAAFRLGAETYRRSTP
jgi:mannan endo-1,4-beta-mannosidase